MDDYCDCPSFPGYTYDKEYYMASSMYASYVDKIIAMLQERRNSHCIPEH
jgi:hypothetical protein